MCLLGARGEGSKILSSQSLPSVREPVFRRSLQFICFICVIVYLTTPPKYRPSLQEAFGQHMLQVLDDSNPKLGTRFDKIDENLATVNTDLHIKDHSVQIS